MVLHDLIIKDTQRRVSGETTSAEGGAVTKVDSLTVLKRFLLLGSTGTFYASGENTTKLATDGVEEAVLRDPATTLQIVLEITQNRRALRNDPALYVLARLTLPDIPLEVRRDAAMAVATVARTGTDFLHWVKYRNAFGQYRVDPDDPHKGRFNRLFRRAIANWFLSRSAGDLALQAVKYDQRDGWTLHDALNMNRELGKMVRGTDHEAVLNWIASDDRQTYMVPNDGMASRLFEGYAVIRKLPDLEASSAEHGQEFEVSAGEIVKAYRLPREAVPGPFLNRQDVWEALFPDMPGRALLRNLGKLENVGLFADPEMRELAIQKIAYATRVCHPFEFLVARAVYGRGAGIRGSLSWKPRQQIMAALEQGFMDALGELEVYEDRRPLIAMDVSGSMGQAAAGTVIDCILAEAALARVFAHQYPNAQFVMYSSGLMPINPPAGSVSQFMAALVKHAKTAGLYMQGTHCDLPVMWAREHEEIDAVVSITDHQTFWRHDPRPVVHQIQESREDFRHAVVAMAMNDISVAEAGDPRQMDFVGADASLPRALVAFLNGEVG